MVEVVCLVYGYCMIEYYMIVRRDFLRWFDWFLVFRGIFLVEFVFCNDEFVL